MTRSCCTSLDNQLQIITTLKRNPAFPLTHEHHGSRFHFYPHLFVPLRDKRTDLHLPISFTAAGKVNKRANNHQSEDTYDIILQRIKRRRFFSCNCTPCSVLFLFYCSNSSSSHISFHISLYLCLIKNLCLYSSFVSFVGALTDRKLRPMNRQ